MRVVARMGGRGVPGGCSNTREHESSELGPTALPPPASPHRVVSESNRRAAGPTVCVALPCAVLVGWSLGVRRSHGPIRSTACDALSSAEAAQCVSATDQDGLARRQLLALQRAQLLHALAADGLAHGDGRGARGGADGRRRRVNGPKKKRTNWLTARWETSQGRHKQRTHQTKDEGRTDSTSLLVTCLTDTDDDVDLSFPSLWSSAVQ